MYLWDVLVVAVTGFFWMRLQERKMSVGHHPSSHYPRMEQAQVATCVGAPYMA